MQNTLQKDMVTKAGRRTRFFKYVVREMGRRTCQKIHVREVGRRKRHKNMWLATWGRKRCKTTWPGRWGAKQGARKRLLERWGTK